MGSQMGKTELVLNVCGHHMDDGPYMPALYVGPTEKQVKSISNDRVDKLLRSTPSLWAKTEKGQRYGTFEKWISGVRWGFAWAGSATELASHPSGLVVIDEIDRMMSDVKGEGDPIELADARRTNFFWSLLIGTTTPTILGSSAGWHLFETGTMYKWAWPCQHCGDLFVPCLTLLRWPKGASPERAARACFVVCPHCGAEHHQDQRHAMNRDGVYIPHERNEETGEHIARQIPIETDRASWWVSGLASTWRDWGRVANKLVTAYRSRNNEKIQAVVNVQGGEPYALRGDAPEWKALETLRGAYGPRTVPTGVQRIVAGVDVQQAGFYYVIMGWGFNAESWLLANGFIPGETEYDQVWLLLQQVLRRAMGDDRHIDLVGIDSGYRPGQKWRVPDHQVYSWCHRSGGSWFPTKGHDKLDRPVKPSKIDISYQGQTIKEGLTLFHIDTDVLKTWLYSRLRWPVGEPGGLHLHREVDEDFLKQLVSEELIVTSSGKRIWKATGPNHYQDAVLISAALALHVLHVHTLPPHQAPSKPAERQAPPAAPAMQREQRNGFIPRPRGSFFGR